MLDPMQEEIDVTRDPNTLWRQRRKMSFMRGSFRVEPSTLAVRMGVSKRLSKESCWRLVGS